MALINGKIHLSLKDDHGVRGNEEFYLAIDNTKTVAQFAADVDQFGALVAALVDGGWVRWEASILPALPAGAGSSPTPDADAEEVGEWSFPQIGSTYLYTIALPTLLDSVVAGSKIDQTNTAVTAFQNIIVSGMTNGTTVLSREFRGLDAVRQTFLGVRKHRKSLRNKSLDIVNP